jgi:hypothetical protein
MVSKPTHQAAMRKQTLVRYVRVGMPVALALGMGIIQDPWVGVALGVMVLAGIGCFFVIRARNSNGR